MHWITATIIAAFFQNLRSSLQKSLNDQMSLMASTYVRFVFALPFSALLFFGYFKDLNVVSDALSNHTFLGYVVLGSLSQIIFTFIFLYSFKFSNFVVGTTLSKTEVIQIAFLELIILNDHLSGMVILGIIISTIGVIIFSVKDLNFFLKNILSKSTLLGIFCGSLLALSIVSFRGATLSLENLTSNFEMAITTLFASTFVQTIFVSCYLIIKERDQFKNILDNKYKSVAAGFSGFIATLFWFYAFSLTQASMVRAFGQIELFFSYLSSRYYFKEKIKLIEIIGITVFVIGILVILFTK